MFQVFSMQFEGDLKLRTFFCHPSLSHVLLLVLSQHSLKISPSSLPGVPLVHFLSSDPALAFRLPLEGQSGGWGVVEKMVRNREREKDLRGQPGKDGSWQYLQACAELCAYLVISSAQSTLPVDTGCSQLP